MKKNKEQGVESDSSSLGEYTAEDDSDEERDRLGSMSDRLRGSKPTHSNGTGCPSPKKVAEPLPAARGSAPEKTRQSINRSSSENRMKFGGTTFHSLRPILSPPSPLLLILLSKQDWQTRAT